MARKTECRIYTLSFWPPSTVDSYLSPTWLELELGLREGFKKKKIRGISFSGVSSGPIFRFFIIFFEKKYELKTLGVAFGSFEDTLIFFNFWVGGPFSAWILVRRVCQTFKAL